VSSACPSRIVCLSAEAVETLYELGAGDSIVGVTAFATHPPDVLTKPRVSGFSTVNYDKIDALQPHLVITFSDVQAEATRELIRRGHTVLATNPRSLVDIFQTILLLGRTVDKQVEAQRFVERMQAEVSAEQTVSGARPKVYFEEWDDPLITGICWVSELIEAAGGADLFAGLRHRPRAMDRVVSNDDVVARSPEVIVASWCGKKVDTVAIAQRPGWQAIPAVKSGRVHEIDSNDILQPGPGLMRGLRQLRAIIKETDKR
jgi:iron complex transport system substrate-binding protein